MLSIQKLRNKAGLFISIAIGLSLLLFVLGDFMKPGKSLFSQKDDFIAKINGEKVSSKIYFDLQKQIEQNYQSNGTKIDDNTRNAIMTQSWDQMLRMKLLQQEYKKLGLGLFIEEHGIIGISPEELKDLIVGNNIDPQMQQIFRNSETGMYDKNIAINFLQNMDKDPEKKQVWLGIEKQLIESRMAQKYAVLVTQGLYATTAEAKLMAAEKNHKVDIRYVAVPFFNLKDSLFKPTEEELETYLKEHKNEYKQETSRDIDYVIYKIDPSSVDIATMQKFITNLIPEFKTTDNDELYVNSNSAIPFDTHFYKKGALAANLDSFAFASPKGSISKVYTDGGYFKASKVAKVLMLPDSVQARHILITKGDAKKTADSLKTIIEKGADFATLAMQYSDDKGSKVKGGDLGWFKEGTMVRPFNDSCFFGKVGKIYIVQSQFGFHVVQVLKRGVESQKVQIATIATKIEASTATRNKIYSDANRFAGENTTADAFEKAAAINKLVDKRIAQNIRPGDRSISGIESARQIVRWVYDAKKGDVSAVFDCGNVFAIACLTGVHEKGNLDLSLFRPMIETEVIKEKKTTKILSDITKIGLYTTLEDLVSKLKNVQIRDAVSVNFGSAAIQSMGMEPKVAGVVGELGIGKLSKPIAGNNAVYVLSATKVDDTPVSDFRLEQKQKMQSLKSRLGYFSFMILKDKADVVDNRLQFE